MASRIIKLVCVNDSHVRDFSDTGVDRNGDPTSNRQALMRVLEKRVSLDSGARVPTFRLAEPPSVQFPGDQDFDDRVLRDGSGNWALPTPEWSAIRAERIGARAAKAGLHEDHARQAMAQQVTGAMVDLAKSFMQGGGAKAPPKAPPKGGAA